MRGQKNTQRIDRCVFWGNSGLLSIKFLCVTLSHMSICTRIVVSVALQEVNHAPNAKSGSKSDNKGLQYVYCAVEKFHKNLLSAALRLPEKGHKKRRSVFITAAVISPRAACVSAARRYSVVTMGLRFQNKARAPHSLC